MLYLKLKTFQQAGIKTWSCLLVDVLCMSFFAGRGCWLLWTWGGGSSSVEVRPLTQGNLFTTLIQKAWRAAYIRTSFPSTNSGAEVVGLLPSMLASAFGTHPSFRPTHRMDRLNNLYSWSMTNSREGIKTPTWVKRNSWTRVWMTARMRNFTTGMTNWRQERRILTMVGRIFVLFCVMWPGLT